MDKYESKHNKLGEKIAALVAAIYNQSILEFCQAAELSNYDGEGYFSFDDMPLTKALANKLIKTVASNIQATIVNGLTASWNIAEQKNDALVNSLFKGKTLTDEQKIRYFQNNEPALKAFINRRTNGMRLSDRVWKYTNDYKNEIEDAISVSIGEGKSAHSLAKEVQQYLQQPDKLFRRVRDEEGNLHLSNNAKNYHPGRGVYRSSYQNAKRLARTEINMAYRTADHTRIQQFDFVVGIEIKTSGNHPEHDICDQLQGRYPKDFKFTGWHPNCRCYQKTILKTDEEMDKDEERMRKGQEPLANSKNSVNDVPDNFKEWVSANTENIENAKNLPYFIRDNHDYISIQNRTYSSKNDGKTNIKIPYISTDYDKNIDKKTQSAINKNKKDLEEYGFKIGVPMTIEDALKGVNPTNDRNNCTLCVPALELRLRGVHLAAKRFNFERCDLDYHFERCWLNTDGSMVKVSDNQLRKWAIENETKYKTQQSFLRAYIDSQTALDGRYQLRYSQVNFRAHTIFVLRKQGKLYFIDPQTESIINFNYNDVLLDNKFYVIRIDDKLMNVDYVENFER